MTQGFHIHDAGARSAGPRSTKRLKELGATIVSEEDATDYAYRYRHRLRRRQAQARQLHRGYRGRRDPVAGLRPGADQGSGRRRRRLRSVRPEAASRAAMPSATPAWRRNPTSISARRIPIGPIRLPTSRSCITASSPTTGGGRRELERKGHRFMSNCDPRADRGLSRRQDAAGRRARRTR